jgi:hypothetical protein
MQSMTRASSTSGVDFVPTTLETSGDNRRVRDSSSGKESFQERRNVEITGQAQFG